MTRNKGCCACCCGECFLPIVGFTSWLCGSVVAIVVAIEIVTGAGAYVPPVGLGIAMVVLLFLPVACLMLWWIVEHLEWVD